MYKKKLCLLGAFGVGKTSLIRKYVFNLYSEKYLCSVGVKVDKKLLVLGSGTEITLMIWDLEGKDDYQMVADTYLRGMSGYFLVADGTRPETLASARGTKDAMRQLFPNVPPMLLLNKADLTGSWAIDPAAWADFTAADIDVSLTSALDGTGVETSFLRIAEKMMRA
jgi:small GTP-binding protein